MGGEGSGRVRKGKFWGEEERVTTIDLGEEELGILQPSKNNRERKLKSKSIFNIFD